MLQNVRRKFSLLRFTVYDDLHGEWRTKIWAFHNAGNLSLRGRDPQCANKIELSSFLHNSMEY